MGAQAIGPSLSCQAAGSTLGSAKMKRRPAPRARMAIVFHREKCSMADRLTSALGLDGFALGAHVADARAQHADLDVLADFDLQFLVVDDLDDLADQAAAGDHRVARRPS